MRDEAFWHNKHPVTNQMYKGRPLPGTDKRYEMDIRHFIWPKDITLLDVIGSNNLSKDNNDNTALEVQNFVVDYLTYVEDNTLGSSEYWLFPEETLELKKGDCEDGAILIASLLLNATPAEQHWRVRVSAGWVRESPTAPQGGHAYCTYCRCSDNKWVILDWCYFPDHGLPVSQKLLASEKKMYKDIWFSFNHQYAYSHTSFIVEGRVRNGMDDDIDKLI